MLCGKTDKGKVRTENQDTFSVGQYKDLIYLLVCDGMGGAKGGSVASDICAKQTVVNIKENYIESMTENEIVKLITTSVEKSNEEIFELSNSEESLKGMGTTIAIVVLRKDRMIIAHVGDSRVYLYTEKDISRKTKDHSFVQEMIDVGELTVIEAQNHPNKNIITRAVGVNKTIPVDFKVENYNEGDIILICTDGLSNFINDNEIYDILNETKATDSSCQKLIDIAIERGGTDNITVVVYGGNN